MAVSIAQCAKQRDLVLFAGAGVSAERPSALPGWKALNAAIVRVLRKRLEDFLHRDAWLAQVVERIDDARRANRFPPEYQAQLIEEMCGERYFHALQALDVNAINAGHDAIAALAAGGALKAVVTTNFDRLIERALDRRSVPYTVAHDDAGFPDLGQRLRAKEDLPLAVIKIHGSVSFAGSMIDTLKQRNRGRARALVDCLDTVHLSYWVYVGFSAADLETDKGYLGLVAGAARSAGAVYVAYPGSPKLGPGAQMLMNAFGDRGSTVIAPVAEYLADICCALDLRPPQPIPSDTALGRIRSAAFRLGYESELSGSGTLPGGRSRSDWGCRVRSTRSGPPR